MNRKTNEQGFTLIEIIIVLVLLGILAATAVPKYFDLQKTARGRSAQAAIAELQARVNMKFAESLLKGNSCTQALDDANTEITTSTDLGGWTFANAATTKATATAARSVKISTMTYGGTEYKLSDFDISGSTGTITFPNCNTADK